VYYQYRLLSFIFLTIFIPNLPASLCPGAFDDQIILNPFLETKASETKRTLTNLSRDRIVFGLLEPQ
jgi:hypothetical protein